MSDTNNEDAQAASWHRITLGENQLHHRKFLVQASKKQGCSTKSCRVGRGVCIVEVYGTAEQLGVVQDEATKKLNHKKEKWKSRGILPPEEATWQRLEFNSEERELRDLVVKRARSKRFRARTGGGGELLFVEVLCHPDQLLQLGESAEEIIREREWESNLNNPEYSLFRKLSANPLKTDDEVEVEQNNYLATLIIDLAKSITQFRKEPDNYFDINRAAKNLHQELFNLTKEGHMLKMMLSGKRSRYIRWFGKRYSMFFAKVSGDRHPRPLDIIDFIDLREIIQVTL